MGKKDGSVGIPWDHAAYGLVQGRLGIAGTHAPGAPASPPSPPSPAPPASPAAPASSEEAASIRRPASTGVDPESAPGPPDAMSGAAVSDSLHPVPTTAKA